MRILVTGGAGFIGTHLCRRLLREGHQVVVVDNESNGSRESVPAQAEFVLGDVTRPDEIEPVFARGLDAICHIAGQVSIGKSFLDPVADLRTNVEGTINVLQMCVKYRIPRLIYASSMTLYGNGGKVPTPESERANPDSYYGITKYAAERYVHGTAERPDLGFDLKVTSLRMFSVYGPGQSFENPYQGVLGIFLGNLMRGEPITIFGDGKQTRDFVFVGDVVDGWMQALNTPETAGGVFNLGSGRSLSINELAARAVAALGHAPGSYPVHRAATRPGEQRSVQADIALARKVLRWEPQTPFEKGLVETARWAKSEFSASMRAPVLAAGA
jgi:UDP-glucose 4-epimerase